MLNPPKKKQDHEGTQHFQDRWVTQLPWVELIVNTKGNVFEVKCAIYLKVERKEKLLIFKLDNLPHISANPRFLGIGQNQLSFLLQSQKLTCSRNEKIYIAKDCPLVLDLVVRKVQSLKPQNQKRTFVMLSGLKFLIMCAL